MRVANDTLGIGSDVMKPIAAPIVGGMITSTIHVLIFGATLFRAAQGAALRRNRSTKANDTT